MSSLDYASLYRLFQSGKVNEVASFLEEHVVHERSNPEFQYLSGLIQLAKGKNSLALETFDKLIKLDKQHLGALYSRGVALARLGRHEQAVESYAQLSTIDPQNLWSFLNKGNSLVSLRDYRAALNAYDEAIKIKPDFLEALKNKGNVLIELKEYQDAIYSFDRALNGRRNYPDAWAGRAIALMSLGDMSQALNSAKEAIKLDPKCISGWVSLAVVCSKSGNFEESLVAYDSVIKIDPNFAKAWSGKSAVLSKIGNFQSAIQSAKCAIDIDPSISDAWANLGVALAGVMKTEEAKLSYIKASELDPNAPIIWLNLGNLLVEQGDFCGAVTAYSRALELDPNIDFALGGLIHAKSFLCDWSGWNLHLEQFAAQIDNGLIPATPFQALSVTDDPHMQRRISEAYVGLKYPMTISRKKIDPYSHKTIRIGFFSPDFREHALSYLLGEVISVFDKTRFELYGFSFGGFENDATTEYLRKQFTEFHEVGDLSDKNIADLARGLEIDIAIDLAGHTKGSRFGIFGYGAAPIQLSYLGYLGTTGSLSIDFLVADRELVLSAEHNLYTESIAYLPWYQANNRDKPTVCEFSPKEKFGLPKDQFVYCSLNNTYKISPEIFSLWMEILKQAKDSVLFIYADHERAISNLRNSAEKHGIPANRLFFGGRLSRRDYLSQYHAMNVFLDTYPYTAGTTASDAIWMGVPVVTLKGRTFASRMASSVLMSCKLENLVASNPEEYIRIATGLYKNPTLYREVCNQVRSCRLSSNLFDSNQFAREFENLLSGLYNSQSFS